MGKIIITPKGGEPSKKTTYKIRKRRVTLWWSLWLNGGLLVVIAWLLMK